MSTIRDQISDLIQTARDVACWEDRNTAENALLNALTMATIGLGTLFEPTPTLKVPDDWGSYTVRIAFDDGSHADYKVRADSPDAARTRAVQRAAFATSHALWGRDVKVIDSPQLRSNVRSLHGLMGDITDTARRAR